MCELSIKHFEHRVRTLGHFSITDWYKVYKNTRSAEKKKAPSLPVPGKK